MSAGRTRTHAVADEARPGSRATSAHGRDGDGAQAERLADGVRVQREVVAGGDERELQPALAEGGQAEERLDAGDAAARDDDAPRLAPRSRRRLPRGTSRAAARRP